jgi:hypothetical protein
MPLQATSGAASYDGFGGGVVAEPNYIESCFSTYLYTGNGSTQTITNGIDLSGKGGMVWIKSRSLAQPTGVFDTVRGVSVSLETNKTTAQNSSAPGTNDLYAFNSNGFSVGSDYYISVNNSGATYASWTFRKQPKFFDVVTYTGTGSVRTVAHNLGSVPGAILIKDTSANSDWCVYHRSLGGTKFLQLNSTSDASTNSDAFNNTNPTDSVFTVGTRDDTNKSGSTLVAYLFAHDAGGFGLTGTDNVISCGSYTGNGSTTGPVINLGYEPQWVMIKSSSAGSAENWYVFDSMRGMVNGSGNDAYLIPNLANAEAATILISPTATGFTLEDGNTPVNRSSTTYIYIAIRRGPMKVPTSGTSVFSPVAYTGTNVDNRLVNSGIVTDMAMARIRATTSTGGFYIADRLRGDASVGTVITSAESTDADSFMTPTVGYGNSFSAVNGFGVGNDVTRQLNQSSTSQLAYALKRAPQFFDVCAYTGTGSATTFTHNLGAVPEIMIVKRRNATGEWRVYVSSIGANDSLKLQTNEAPQGGSAFWDSTTPTASVFTVGTSTDTNASGSTYINYLFATCAGVSKVGSYTGTGTTKQINCGFTGGARFVLIKRTDATGDWYVWDTARGIVAGNDPYLVLNTVTGEQTGDDYIDTYSAGFELSSTAPVGINDSGGTFIFLAIA